MKKSLTFTIIANITANYGESLGNISSIQKVYKNGIAYGCRSMESMKYAIMEQSGFYDDLQVEAPKKVANKLVNENVNLSNNKSLEGGYMSTEGTTKTRSSSFRVTPAVSTTPFNGDSQFHNNLNLARKVAELTGKNLQDNATECGLMPYNYEYDKDMKIYSVTIHLDEIGKDSTFDISLDNEEKCDRVISLIKAIQNLDLIVKGSLDNAEPLFIIGGLSERKSHVFENLISVKDNKVLVTDDLKDRSKNYQVGVMSNAFDNSNEIKTELNATSIDKFFESIIEDVKNYYN